MPPVILSVIGTVFRIVEPAPHEAHPVALGRGAIVLVLLLSIVVETTSPAELRPLALDST